MDLTRNMTFAAVATVALMLSAGLNVVLGVRVSQQRTAIARGSLDRQLQLGRRIDPIEATDRDGHRVLLDFSGDGRPTILYTFQPGCAWCLRNHVAIVALHTQLSEEYRFLGVSLTDDGLEEMLAARPLPFDVVSGVSGEVLESYQLGGTPRTLVLDSTGVIELNFFGAFIGNNAREIEARFAVDLPAVYTGD